MPEKLVRHQGEPMTDYTPTTQEVRDEWRWNGEDYGPAADAARTAEFDRWLADVIREAKAEAWDDGYKSGWDDAHDGTYKIDDNPHR